MSPRRSSKVVWPTNCELEVLQILWERGPHTVRELHHVLCSADSVGYTTILKRLQIMWGKGLVQRDDSQRTHVYRTTINKQHTQKRYLAKMTERLFNGSPSELVLNALGSLARVSPVEIRKIGAHLNKIKSAEKTRQR